MGYPYEITITFKEAGISMPDLTGLDLENDVITNIAFDFMKRTMRVYFIEHDDEVTLIGRLAEFIKRMQIMVPGHWQVEKVDWDGLEDSVYEEDWHNKYEVFPHADRMLLSVQSKESDHD